jgi:phosphoribosylamine---glycine ligase
MRLLILDPPGHGLDIAIRARDAGHEVKLAIREDERTKHIGEGFVDVVRNHKEWMRWAQLVLCTDNSLYLRDLDSYRDEGGLVIGPSQEAAKWELDRKLGQDVFRKAGIDVATAKEFHSYDDAISFVKKTMGRFVSKPCDDANADKSLSYCSSGPDDMIYMLERWKKSDKLKGSFILQEFVSGVEMGCAGWFGPHGFNSGFEEDFEFKKLMNGECGPATGEQGTVLRYVKNSKLADLMLKPLIPQLEALNYVGDVGVNCIIDEQGKPWPLEFTMRLGWPAFQLQTALIREDRDPVEWLMHLAMGRDARPFSLDLLCIGVVLSIPDYPYSRVTRKEVCGIPLLHIPRGGRHHIHPCEMQMGEAWHEVEGELLKMPCMMTAGDYVLTMTATDSTVQDARRKVYRRLEAVKKRMPGSPMYRTDIGMRLAKQLPEIQRHGFARGLTFSNQQSS